MKIGIHKQGSGNFTPRWISYCERNKISFKIVNCYENDIIDQLVDCDIFIWHFHNNNYKDALFAKQFLFVLQSKGVILFPDINTSWHFDDKVGQKYLLESIKAPLVPSYVFYSKSDALEFVKNTIYPKVFKLRGGAGSSNVRLVSNVHEAKKIIGKAFGEGFSAFNRWNCIRESIRKYREKKQNLCTVFRSFGRLFIPTRMERMFKREKGYVYFQEFIPNNESDIRIIVIDNKAFAIKRMVRKNDFRASGSGHILYDKDLFDIETIKLAFEVTDKLQVQSVAYDFVYGLDNVPLIVEISYGFDAFGYDKCPGYWDRSLEYISGIFSPQDWIIDMLITKYQSSK